MAESTVNKKSISALDPISDNNVSLSAKSPVQQPNQIPFEQVTLNQIKRTIIAECSTAAATANKTATVTNFAGFALIPGMEILVHFTNANTASNITLSINDTNAYPIKVLGTTEQLGNGSIKAGTYKKLIFTGDTYLTEAPTISAVNSGSDLPLNSVALSKALSPLSRTFRFYGYNPTVLKLKGVANFPCFVSFAANNWPDYDYFLSKITFTDSDKSCVTIYQSPTLSISYALNFNNREVDITIKSRIDLGTCILVLSDSATELIS